MAGKLSHRLLAAAAVISSLFISLASGYSGGTGDPNTPYQIASKADLLQLAGTTSDYDKCFILTADIDLAGTTYTTALIAPDTDNVTADFQGTAFTGIFNGNDYAVSGLTINDGGAGNGCLGFFGQLGSGGLVKGVIVENVSIVGSSGSVYVGALVAWATSATVEDSSSSGTVNGGSRVGGLVGHNQGSTFNRCRSSAGVIASGDYAGGLCGVNPYGSTNNIWRCYATGNVSGASRVGGLVGVNSGRVYDCYAKGSVTAATSGYAGGLVGYQGGYSITNCYSTGQVSGDPNFHGGLVGIKNAGSITNSFWDIQTSGRTTSAGGTGKTTSQMQDASTFLAAGWDFVGETANGTNDYWQMLGNGYPLLAAWPVDSGVVDEPLLSPGGGTYGSGQSVVVMCGTAGATMHYTTNGVDPTESNPVIASGASIFVDHSLTLKAKAWKGTMTPSGIVSSTYTIFVATPVFGPNGGTYNSEQNVVVTCATPGAIIHYTTDGVDPTEVDPVIVSGNSLYVDHTLTLKAKAWKASLTPSSIKSATYNVVVATPAFNPDGGTYNSEQNVVVTCATAGAAIHYTTGIDDANTPDPTESDPVIEPNIPFLIDQGLTLNAKAWKGSMTPSNIKSATYNIVVATPVFNPNGGSYVCEQDVLVTCSTVGATIHYTTNGLDPDESDPVIASGDSILVSVDPPTTLKARGFKTNFAPSSIEVGVYVMAVAVHVSPDGNDLSDGLSWASAKRTLEAALAMATTGDEIWVATGTYKPAGMYSSYRMKNGVGIYGGFAGTETDANERNPKTNLTVLSGDIGVAGDPCDNCDHIFYNPPSSPEDPNYDIPPVLDGFTITGGNAGVYWSNRYGGAIYNAHGPIVINGCRFAANVSRYGGGAIYTEYSAIALTDCVFVDNDTSSEGDGGAIYAAYSPVTLTNCRFMGNTANYGGAIYAYWGNTLILTDCLFSGNKAVNAGGAICCKNAQSIKGCTFSGNTAYHGGAVFEFGNTAMVRNSILWGNTAGSSAPQIYGTVSVTFSNIQGGWSGTGNINANPTFVRNPYAGSDGIWGTADDDYGDLRLRADSPCIDMGSNVYATIPVDLAGNPRIADGDGDGTATVDIGAYERQCVTNPAGDVSYDCGVEFVDYAMLLAKWGQSGCSDGNWWCYRADVDESGTVDILDMAAVVEHWLEGVAAGGS